MKPSAIPFRALAAALPAALLLSACASLFEGSGTPEEQVARRAQKRWDALIAGDFGAAYDYLQPAYRAAFPRDTYKSNFGSAGRWKSVQISKVTCEAERCTVRIGLTVINMVPTFARSVPEITTWSDEVWVREESRWWYYQTP